ncbi:espin-like protein isoform X3 [Nematostella vectensis]|uniref:espin-like protein isoform X3 n=1 Tax=Nematostella vectensis TaxID=45351 RepID=UPI002077228B|nr:espin-like protein isoform X3 [Nematostella vectensis]
MPREKKCPGCKKPVNDHDFGVPGKHCDGPGGVPEIRGNSTTRNDELLNSLAAAVQTLTAEVQSLKADHASSRQSHSLPPSDIASSSRSSKDVSPRRTTTVTLPELRAMDDLADAADRRVAHVLPIASSESDEEADMGALASSPLRKPNKAEFVAGYAQILQLREISSFERAKRHKHLVTLMYHAQLYEWEAVLAFHGAVLLEIERGLLKWGDSFSHLESRTLHGQLLSPPKKQSYSSGPTLFCRDYQREKCIYTKDHYGYVRGERKWVKHICAACWVQSRKQESHREDSSDCPLSGESKN